MTFQIEWKKCYIEGKFRLNEEYITKLFISMDNWISDKNQNFEAVNWYCCTIILSPFPILEDNIHNDGVSNEQKSNQDCRQDNVCKMKKKTKISGKFTSSRRNFRLLIRHFAVHVSSKHMAQWTLYPDWLIDRSLLNSLPMFPRSDNHLIETNVNEDICIFFWWLYYSRDLYEIILFEVDIWSLWLIYFFVFLKSNSIFWNYRKVYLFWINLLKKFRSMFLKNDNLIIIRFSISMKLNMSRKNLI